MISFGKEVKPSVTCSKILRHVKDTCSMQRDIYRLNSRTFLGKFLPALLLGVSAGYCQRDMVDESRIIRTQMGKDNRSVMVAVYGTPLAIPPLKQ
jgi:hypothetical protein